MASSITIAIPYLISEGISIIMQTAYLVYFKGRMHGVSIPLSKIGNKFIVDLLSIIIVAISTLSPFLLYWISGIHLAANESFEGIYILLIFSLHSLFLTFLFWKMRKWRLMLFVRVFFLLSLLTFMTYLITAINLDDFYSLSGSTAIFMSCSFIFGGSIHHQIDMLRNRVYFTKYLHAMSEAETHETSKDVIQRVNISTKSRSIRLIVAASVWYLLTMLGYCISVNAKAVEEETSLGWMHSLIVVITDGSLLGK